MSLLSQFFPSGGGVTKIDFLLVGGGGGGGASGGYPACMQEIGLGGGGGGGQVVIGEDYETTPGITYSITIGAGGAGGGFYFPPSFFAAPPLPTSCYAINKSMKRGSDGGDTFLGSIRSLGGGGGGSGFSCVICCEEHSFKGRNYGTGGGAGACSDANVNTSSPDQGNAIANYSIGQTIKLGTVGQRVEKSDCWESIYASNCWYKGVSGGGGNASGAQSGGTGYLELRTPFVNSINCCCIYQNFTKVACEVGGIQTWIPNKWCGYLTGGAAAVSESASNRASHQYSYHGVDGYLTNIEGAESYYGGGGGVAWSMANFGNLYHGVAIDPSNPCWPTFSNYKCYACPYGGQGGGATIKADTVRPTCPYWTSFSCGAPLGYPSCCLLAGRVLYNGESGLGGGGAAHYLSGQPNTGPVFPGYTQCAYCGTNGGSGVVIIRYPTNFAAATVTGNTPTTPQSGYHVYKWTSPGTIQFN